MTPKRRSGAPTDASRCVGCTLSSVVCDAQWLACSFLDVVHPWLMRSSCALTTPLVWFLTAYYDGRHGRTMITCDTSLLPIKVPDVQRGYWPVAIHIRSFCVLCMICQASSCGICIWKVWIRLSRASVERCIFRHVLPGDLTKSKEPGELVPDQYPSLLNSGHEIVLYLHGNDDSRLVMCANVICFDGGFCEIRQ